MLFRRFPASFAPEQFVEKARFYRLWRPPSRVTPFILRV